MRKSLFVALIALGLVIVFSTASMAGLVNYERLNKKKNAGPAIAKIQGIIADVNYRNSEITVKDNTALTEHKFIVSSDMITGLSKGKRVEVAFHQGSGTAQSVNVLKE